MASYVKFEQFAEDLGKGVHQLHATGHTLKVYLSNTAPNVSTHAVKADLAEIATGNGYSGAVDIENDYTETGGTGTLTGVDKTITASGGTIGPFRYVVLFNDTPTTPADPLIAYWDYGSSITLQDTEDFDIDFGSSVLTVG